MIYCDTSFVAPLVLPEAASEAVEAFVQQLPPSELAVSHWTRVEFASLVGRRIRLKELNLRQARLVRAEFERMLDESFEVVAPRVEDFNFAEALLQDHRAGLRAGDALHLAIAGNRKAGRFLTLDAALIKAAKRLRIPAEAGIKYPRS